MNQFEKYKLVWKIWTSLKKFKLGINLNHNIDLALPFGLRSAPYIFNTVAEAVEWILVNSYKIPDLLHYLDVTAALPTLHNAPRT